MKTQPILIGNDGIILSRALRLGHQEYFSFVDVDHVDIIYRNRNIDGVRSAQRPQFFVAEYPNHGGKKEVRLWRLWQLLEVKEQLLNNKVNVKYVTNDDSNMQVLEQGKSEVYKEEWQIVHRWMVGGIVAFASIFIIFVLIFLLTA